VKRYGPYRLTSLTKPDVPAPYEYVHAILEGENLPMLKLAGHSSTGTSAFTAENINTPEGIPPAVINGVPYSMRIDMHLYPTGWELYRDPAYAAPNIIGATWHSLSMHRTGSWSFDNASDAARKHAREIIVPALAAWLASDEARPFLSAGQGHHKADRMAAVTRKVVEAEKALADARAELAEVEAMPNE
jgi:hypothetical protein